MSMRIKLALAAALTVGMAGCSSIGDGAKLESLQIVKTSSLLGVSDDRLFLCFNETLQLLGTFSDGTVGDFTSRADWRSSSAAVRVSNADILVPGSTTFAFPSGTLIPTKESPTPVTIHADFVGLSAEFTVASVEEPGPFALTPAVANVAVGSLLGLTVTTTVDNFPIDVTRAASWAFETPDTTKATIGAGNGVVLGVAPTTTAMVVKPTFIVCQLATELDRRAEIDSLQSSISVAVPASLALSREFGATEPRLVLGTTNALQTTASFASGPTQDLSRQVTYASSGPTFVTVVPSFTAGQPNTGFGGVRNVVQALAPGDATITATFGTDAGLRTSNPLQIQAVQASLVDVVIPPGPYKVNALGQLQMHANGRFDLDNVVGAPVNEFIQDITRHVVWTTSDSTVAVISNETASAGLLFARKSTAGTVTVTATDSVATGIKAATETVCIGLPPSGAPCP
ncbi:MAG TPA: hypothetical protein VM074_00755 [Solimonas sp.]|nr:hypothetical protein [Solimonas sp.]